MSAFIVSTDCINNILTICQRAEWNREGVYACLSPPTPLDDLTLVEEYGDALVAMNYRAVNARYRQSDDSPRHKYKHSDGLTEWQGLKSLDCFLYQCHEGDVPNELLYQDLYKFRDQLRNALLRNVPEYESAQWG